MGWHYSILSGKKNTILNNFMAGINSQIISGKRKGGKKWIREYCSKKQGTTESSGCCLCCVRQTDFNDT